MNKKILIGILSSVSILTLTACGGSKTNNNVSSTNSISESSITSSITNKSSESISEKSESSALQIIEETSSTSAVNEEYTQEISTENNSIPLTTNEQSEDYRSNDNEPEKTNSYTNDSETNTEAKEIPNQTIYSLDNLTGTWKDTETGFIYLLGPLGYDDYFSWGSQAVERVIYLSSASSNGNTVTANWGRYRETPAKNKVTIIFNGDDEVNVNFNDGTNYSLVRSK
ncbi:hypothetical protein BG261_00080 [Floricoccus tropicus]|uniref:Lipoprotein n=1 Tax=Floricoccus tropicus TaxID=1859473 RepID=A0A1E8GPY8_9LACT|nr:hypothetical protein [Floricoccus tropicus]OFI50321.1 hypothetical protein BG261_00080 [Floricoccus tropicus]